MPKAVERKWYFYEWEKKVAGKERNVVLLPGAFPDLEAAMKYILEGGTRCGAPRLKTIQEVHDYLPKWLDSYYAYPPYPILPGYAVYVDTVRGQLPNNKVVGVQGAMFDQVLDIQSRIEGNALIVRVDYVSGWTNKEEHVEKKFIVFEAL